MFAVLFVRQTNIFINCSYSLERVYFNLIPYCLRTIHFYAPMLCPPIKLKYKIQYVFHDFHDISYRVTGKRIVIPILTFRGQCFLYDILDLYFSAKCPCLLHKYIGPSQVDSQYSQNRGLIIQGRIKKIAQCKKRVNYREMYIIYFLHLDTLNIPLLIV